MLPQAYISHRTSNRLRVKVPSKKGDAGYFSALSAQFSKLPGMEKVEANPVTGTVLLVSSDRISQERIGAYTEANQLFRLTRLQQPKRSALSGRVAHNFGQLDERVRSFTGGEIDIPSIAFLGLIGAGLYQLSIGNLAIPAWYTAFWYATSILLKDQASDTSSAMI